MNYNRKLSKSERKHALNKIREMVEARDEIKTIYNSGRQRTLLMRMGAVGVSTGGRWSTVRLPGGWEFSSDSFMNSEKILADRIYDHRIKMILKIPEGK